ADAASRRRNGDLGHADLGVELGGALRQLRRRERLLLADVAGADRVNHQVAQGHRRAHLGQQPVHGRGGSRRIDFWNASGGWTLVDERPRFWPCIAPNRGHELPPGACAVCAPDAAPRQYRLPRAVARSAMFLSVADARLLCEPSTWHSTAGPTSIPAGAAPCPPAPISAPNRVLVMPQARSSA